jgi:hypothetical protein
VERWEELGACDLDYEHEDQTDFSGSCRHGYFFVSFDEF